MSGVIEQKMHSGFIQIPYEFFQQSEGRFSGRVETLLRGVIYGFSSTDSTCRFSYSAFEEYINRSRATVARAVGGLRDASNDVNITRKGGQASEYQYVGEVARKRKHVRVPLFLFYEMFDMPKGKNGDVENRLLTMTEVLIYSLIVTHSQKNKGDGVFEGSEISIAKILNCSQRSVSRAIYALMKADMISRPKKGKNRYSATSTYRADLKLYRMLWKKHNVVAGKDERTTSKRVPPKKISDADLNAHSEHERYYSRLQNTAQAALERNLKKANAVPGFADVVQKRRVLDIALAKAEVHQPDKLPALRAEERTLTFEYNRLLRIAGLTSADLTLKYHCSACRDSGYQKDGKMCTCYGPPKEVKT